MSTTAKNRAKEKGTRQRRRAVETEYLAGYGPAEIHDRLFKSYPVMPQTIRKDIVEVRKAWTADIDAVDEFEGRHRYLASLRELRKKAMIGWDEEGKFGSITKGVDYVLCHKLDQEIARLSGVNLKVDDKNINLNLKAAVAHMEDILQAVFSVVHDSEMQDRVIEAIDAIAAE